MNLMVRAKEPGKDKTGITQQITLASCKYSDTFCIACYTNFSSIF